MSSPAKEKRIRFIRTAIDLLNRELDAVPEPERDSVWHEHNRDRARLLDRLAGLLGEDANRARSHGEEFTAIARRGRRQEQIDKEFQAAQREAKHIARRIRVGIRDAMREKDRQAEKQASPSPRRCSPLVIVTCPAERQLEACGKSADALRILEHDGEPAPEPIYRVGTLAERCGVSAEMVKDWLDRGLRHLPIGNGTSGRRRDAIILESWLLTFLDAQSVVTPRPRPSG